MDFAFFVFQFSAIFRYTLTQLIYDALNVIYYISKLAVVAGFVITFICRRNIFDIFIAIGFALSTIFPLIFVESNIAFWFLLAALLLWAYKLWLKSPKTGIIVAGAAILSTISSILMPAFLMTSVAYDSFVTIITILTALNVISYGLEFYAARLDSKP